MRDMGETVKESREEWCRQHLPNYDLDVVHYPHSLPDRALRFTSKDDLVNQVKRSGSHFFDTDTVRLFSSRTHDLIDGWVLITSERDAHDRCRVYSVRYVHRTPDSPRLSLETVRGFGAFPTLGLARSFARHMAKVFS